MKIQITIEPGKYTGKAILWIQRHRATSGVLALLVSFVALWAAPITKPFTFANGGTVSASEMNSNFDALYNAIAQRVGTFCGFTAATYDGLAVGGLAGAKNKCETACSDTRAHFCTGHEIVISLQNGVSLAGSGGFGAFYHSGMRTFGTFSDCADWTANTATNYGGGIDNAGTLTSNKNCGITAKLACCL